MIHGKKVVLKALTKESAKLILKWVNQEELRSLTGSIYPVSEYEHDSGWKPLQDRKIKKFF